MTVHAAREVQKRICGTLRCVPPSTTAQMKRLRIVRGQPVFFHGAKMEREAVTWAALLRPLVPSSALAGAVRVVIVGVWPHTKSTPKRDRGALIPKTSKPDASNYAKHLEDLLVRMRFLAEDSHVASITVEKWRGPETAVGIRILIEPLPVGAAPALSHSGD